MQEHFDDEYVQRAKQQGFRSRAVYKLKELDEKYQILKTNMTVVDLGAAPGGWSQYAKLKVGDKGIVVASDILPMDNIAGAEIIIGDFTEQYVVDNILSAIRQANLTHNNEESSPVHLVISDMAPNMSGVDSVDIPKAMYLVELAADFARQNLHPGGAFLTKMFQGEGSDSFLKDLKQQYSSVLIKKPKASRPRSREVYVYAKGFGAIKAQNTGND